MTQPLTQTISRLFLLGILLSFALGLNYLHAWTAPTLAPTDGNVAAPLNVGGTHQGKSGALTIASTLDVGSSLTVGGVLGDSASYLIDMGAATPSATAGIRFPDDTVMTTAGGGAAGGIDYTPTINGLTWQNITLTNSPISSYMGGYQCGPLTTLTLSAGNGVSDASEAAAVSIYSYDNDEASQGYKVYDMSDTLQGVFGRASRGGDGQGFGAGGELVVKLTSRQFKLSLCRRSGAPAAVTYFTAKGVVN